MHTSDGNDDRRSPLEEVTGEKDVHPEEDDSRPERSPSAADAGDAAQPADDEDRDATP